MHKAIWYCYLFLLLTSTSFAQEILVTDENSHEAFTEELKSSKDLRYKVILEKYDTYIAQNPDDVSVKVKRCKFIGSAFYDEYEEYNVNWEETESCVSKLFETYPEEPSVILYKLAQSYGDEYKAIIDSSIDLYYQSTEDWTDTERSSLFELAAYQYSETSYSKTLEYADKAERFNTDTDLSVLTAQTYMEMGNSEKAKEVLDIGLYYDRDEWVLSQKADLLVKLGEFDKAMTVYDRIREKDSSYVDNTSIYKILLGEGEIEKARTYLVNDTVNEWNKEASLQNLLNHDIDYGSADVAMASYIRMQEESYYEDFFGMKRIRIFLKDPFGSWSAVGFTHIWWLVALLLVLLLVPYVWVLPIYGLSKYFKWNNSTTSYWGLKHFWLISFIYLMAQVMLSLLFYYDESMNYLFDVGNYSTEEDEIISPLEMITFSSFLLVSTLLFLNRKRLKYIFRSTWSIPKIMGMSLLFFFMNIIIIRLLGNVVDLSDMTTYAPFLSIRPEILALLNEKGFFTAFLIVAVFAPFYEEIIFRGIILNSTSKRVGFISANIIQASLFGLIHFNLALFPFYFIFGLVTGYVAKRTNGLVTGMIYHAVNNGIAVVVLYYVSKYLIQ